MKQYTLKQPNGTLVWQTISPTKTDVWKHAFDFVAYVIDSQHYRKTGDRRYSWREQFFKDKSGGVVDYRAAQKNLEVRGYRCVRVRLVEVGEYVHAPA